MCILDTKIYQLLLIKKLTPLLFSNNEHLGYNNGMIDSKSLS